jgi:hypothetical protein
MPAPSGLSPDNISSLQRHIRRKVLQWKGQRYYRATPKDIEDCQQDCWVKLLEVGPECPKLNSELDGVCQEKLYGYTYGGQPRTRIGAWDTVALDDVWREVSERPGPDYLEQQIEVRVMLLEAWSRASTLEQQALSLSGGEPGGISEDEMRQHGWKPGNFRAAVRQFRARLEPPPVPTPRQKTKPTPAPANFISMKDACALVGMSPANFWSLAQRQQWPTMYFADRSAAVQRSGAKILYIERSIVETYIAEKNSRPARKPRGSRAAGHGRRAQN